MVGVLLQITNPFSIKKYRKTIKIFGYSKNNSLLCTVQLKKQFMKRLKILSTLLLICFVVATFQNSLTSFVNGFSLGWNIGEYEEMYETTSQTYLAMKLTPKSDLLQMNTLNVRDSSSMMMLPEKATFITFKSMHQEASGEDKFHSVVDALLNVAILSCFVVVLVLVVKIILSFRRSEVFEERNISRINLIGRILIIIGVLNTLWEFLHVFLARRTIALTDFEISYTEIIDWENIIIGLVVLLMNEILIMATGMKKEQELTI